MDRKARPNPKSTFLESIPSQLRYAYLALKKKQGAKAVDIRDRDNDLKEVITGHNFGYLSFDNICKNKFEPEDCLLRFDAVSCTIVLKLSLSQELLEFPLFEMIKPSPQFQAVNKRTRNVDPGLVLSLSVITDNESGSKKVVPMHFLADDTNTVMVWRHALRITLAESATSVGYQQSDWGASFLWRVWRTVPAPEISLYNHLFDQGISTNDEAVDQSSIQPVEYGPGDLSVAHHNLLSQTQIDGSPIGKLFDSVLYRESRPKSESLSFLELLSSANPKDVHQLKMLQDAGIESEIDLTLTTACAAGLWDDAYGMVINSSRSLQLDGIRADGNTALHFICNQDPKSPISTLGNGSIYEKLLRALLEKGGEKSINSANRQGVTPLMIATSWSNEVLVQLLVNLSADITAQDAMGNTPFHYAVCFSDPAVLAKLCVKLGRMRRSSYYEGMQLPQTGNQAKARFKKIQTAVTFATFSSLQAPDERPSDFYSFSQSISSLNSSGHSCLHLAIARRDTGYLCKILDLLDDFGLQARLLCALDHCGETPLHFACRNGCIEDIMVLLFHGSRVGAISDDGSTAESLLRQYVSKNQQENKVLRLVIMLGEIIQKEEIAYEHFLEQKQEKSANTTLIGSQVLFCQVLHKKRQIGIGMPSLMSMLDLMPTLMSYCPNLASSCDWIMKLVEGGDAEKLIEHVSDVGETIASCLDLTDSDGNTLLHKAVEFKHFDITAILLDAGADASKENLSGISAVHIAAFNGTPDFFFSLMSSLMHEEQLFHSRANIMHYAASGGNLDILNALHCIGGLVCDESGSSNGAFEAAMRSQQFQASIYIACLLPFPVTPQAIMFEIKDFCLKLEAHRCDWHVLMDPSTQLQVHSELQATIVDANGLMIAHSLTSNDESALWRHASDELWQSLSKWQSRDEHRHHLVHIAVINCRYEALSAMILNGHNPAVLDGKFQTPIHYACLHGNWRLVAVLRILYLVPLGAEEFPGGLDTLDDSLLLEVINNDDTYVLMTLLLLHAPLSKRYQEIVVNAERNSKDAFPSPIVRAFEMQKTNTFHLLISGCFHHSFKMQNGQFECILMHLKNTFVYDAEFDQTLETGKIIHRLTQAIDTIMTKNHAAPASSIQSEPMLNDATLSDAWIETIDGAMSQLHVSLDASQQSTSLNGLSEIVTDCSAAACLDMKIKSYDSLALRSTASLNASSHGASNSTESDWTLKCDNFVAQGGAEASIVENAASSVQLLSESAVAEQPMTVSVCLVEKQTLSTCELDVIDVFENSEFRLLQPCTAEAKAVPPYVQSVVANPACSASSQENVTIADNHVDDSKAEATVFNVCSNTTTSLPSPAATVEDEHYHVKESLTFSLDTFELDVDPENRNAEPAVKFEVQDVLPAVRVEDHIGISFLNACKLGLDQVLVSLVDGFSVDSILRSSIVTAGNPMHLAIQANSLPTVEILLKWKPTLIFDADKDGCTPFHAVCKINFHAALSKFLGTAACLTDKLKEVDREGHSCLTMAVKQGASECVELLAKFEDDALNVPSTSIPSALELSLTSSFYSSGIFMRLFNLCSEQAINNFRSSHDNGLLQVAVKYQRMYSVCAILRRMGDGAAQIRDATGRTAVEIAAASSNKSMFNLLVQQTENNTSAEDLPAPEVAARAPDKQYFCDADPTNPGLLRSFPGGSSVTCDVIDQICLSVRGETKGSGLLQLLQKMVASGNAHLLGKPLYVFGPHDQCTCLHLAAGVNSLVCLQYVLDNCSRSRRFIDMHNSSGMTACAVALMAGHTNCAKLLLMHGSRIVSKSIFETSKDSIQPKMCNLLHICAKHCHDRSMMEQLLDGSTTSNIFCLNDSGQTLLHICAHVNNVHAYTAIANKAPYAINILINHRDELGNTALHVCSSNSGSLTLVQALLECGCHTNLRNYDGDLAYDIAGFMGNMDIAQLTRASKAEEFDRQIDFRTQCVDFKKKLVDVISNDKTAELSNMCKSPIWIGSWLSFNFMESQLCAEKASDLKTAIALSNAGLCALSCPLLVENLLGIMMTNRQMSITKALDAMLVGCRAEPCIEVVSSFLTRNFPLFIIQVAADKTLEPSIFAWVVKYWTSLSFCDSNGYNPLEVACKSDNVGFFQALICHLETLESNAKKNVGDAQIFHCLKSEIIKALSRRTDNGRSFVDSVSDTSVGNSVMRIISLVSFKLLLRTDSASQDEAHGLINQRYSTLVSFGLVDMLFQDPDFDVTIAKKTRDTLGRCLVAIACISGQVTSLTALLEKGFPTSLVDYQGLNILHHAVSNHKDNVVYFILHRFPEMVSELDSKGCCVLHYAVCNGSDDDCMSTLMLIENIVDEITFVQLCLHLDDSNSTAIEESFCRGNYSSGMYLLQNVVVKCGSSAANPIHVFEGFVKGYLLKTFQLISDFNAIIAKISIPASEQNSLMSFVKVFCSDLPPLEDDDTLQHQSFYSASASMSMMNSGLKSSSFFSGQWVCMETTFSDHFLVPGDTSCTRASLAQIFSAVYDNTAFSNLVRPSVSEALIAHSLRLNWILQDGVALFDCERTMSIHSALIRNFLVLERLSLIFYSRIQTFCRDQYLQLICFAPLPQQIVETIPVQSERNEFNHAIDVQKLNAVGIYPPVSCLPEAVELFGFVTTNSIDSILCYMKKSTKYLTMSLDVHKNTLAHAVAFYCRAQDVEQLITAGLTFNVRNDSAQMPFHFACLAGRFEVAQACLRSFGFQKSDQLPVDSYGNSMLHFAALSLNEQCLSSIQQTYQIPWDLAATSQRHTALDLVLELGADPKQHVCALLVKGEALTEACKSKLVSVQLALQSSLFASCRLDSQAKAVCCVHAGADIETCFALEADNGEHTFWNAIDVCAAYNSVSVMKSIFDNVEIDVWLAAVKCIKCNRRNKQQPAPVWVACQHGSLKALKFLLENGSNLLDENGSGLNIFAYCVTIRSQNSLLELLHFSSAFFSDAFLDNLILTADKTGQSCIERAIESRYPEPIRILRRFFLNKNTSDVIMLGLKYLKCLCQSQCKPYSDPFSTLMCMIEVLQFFDKDVVQALILSYRDDGHPLKWCSTAGAHDTAILFFILHILAGVDFNGEKMLGGGFLGDSDQRSNLLATFSQSGSSTMWNALQLIERILHAFTGTDSWTRRYLSFHLGQFIMKLDDNFINQFFTLLLTRNESVLGSLDLWENFFSRSKSSFKEMFVGDASKHEPYCLSQFNAEQNELLDAIYRGDSLVLNKIILRNPGVYLHPEKCDMFHNQCYIAAIFGDQEYMLEVLIQKGFQYSQQSGKENLLMLASRLGRSKIIRSLRRWPRLELNINYRTPDGICALHMACARNYSETVQSLLMYFPSIDVSALTTFGESAISLCVKHGHVSALEKILECVGVQKFLSIVNAAKQNVFHLAAVANNSSVFQAVCTMVLKALNQTHVFGGKEASCELLKSLIESSRFNSQPEKSEHLCAALCAQDVNGDTPAHICINSRSVAALAILMHACPVACLMPNASGSSPLHLAASTSCFSVDTFRLLVSAVKSLGPWIFDNQSRQQLLEQNYVVQATLMAALCHFENTSGATVWDIAFSENLDAQICITKFISLCRLKNLHTPHFSRFIASSTLKSLFSEVTIPSSKRENRSRRLGSMYLSSIHFLQNILKRSKLNRWYAMQLDKRIYEAKQHILSSCLLQRIWRHYIASKLMKSAKHFKLCCIRIQCSYRAVLSRRILILRKNLSQQLLRIERARSIWIAYVKFIKRKSALKRYQHMHAFNAEFCARCSISGALQLQAAVMTHHLYLLWKRLSKRTFCSVESKAASTIQKVFRGREGRRLFLCLRELSDQERSLILPSGRKLHVHKYIMLRFIRRMQCAVRFLLAKRRVTIVYFSKNGLNACRLIQRMWLNHFSRVQLRRLSIKRSDTKLSVVACKIQKHVRGKLSRTCFRDLFKMFCCSKSAVTLQCAFRCRLALQIFRHRADEAASHAHRIRQAQDLRVFIENESLKSKRVGVEHHLLLLKSKAATVISSLIRGVILRCRKLILLKKTERQSSVDERNSKISASKIQHAWFSYCALKQMRSLGWSFGENAKRLVAIRRIISNLKIRAAFKDFRTKRRSHAVIKLQNMWRVYRSCQRCQKIRYYFWNLRYQSNATKIQAVFKAHRVRLLKLSWPKMRELRISKKVLRQLFNNFQSSKFHKIVMKTLMTHKHSTAVTIQCAFRSKLARHTFRSIVSLHNMKIVEKNTKILQSFWRRCLKEKRFCSKLPWMLFPWPSVDVQLEASAWSISHAYDVRLESFMQSKQFDEYSMSLSAACQFGMRQLQDVPEDAAYALQSLVRFAASMCETALYHGNKEVAFSLASKAVKLLGSEKTKFVLNCRTEFSAWVLDTLAHVFYSRGLFVNALPLLNEAIVAGGLRSSLDNGMLAILHFHKGLVYQELGNIISAKDNFLRACQMFLRHGDQSYSMHLAAAQLALSSASSSHDLEVAAENSHSAKNIMSRVSTISGHETFYPPSMCWRSAGLQRILRRIALVSTRFIQNALLKIERSKMQSKDRILGRSSKSRPRRTFNRTHLFPQGIESWARWSMQSLGAYGIISESSKGFRTQQVQGQMLEMDRSHSVVDYGRSRENAAFENKKSDDASVQQEESFDRKLEHIFLQMRSAPILIHPYHLYEKSTSIKTAFQDIQYLLSSCMDVTSSLSSQQRWLNLLQSSSPDGQLPSFVRDLVTHSPNVAQQNEDSAISSVKVFSASPIPAPRKDIVSCLHRVLAYLLQRAYSLWYSCADGQCPVADCKESVQLLKDITHGSMNSLKHAVSKSWKYAIRLCDAALLALSSEYSEAFNCCMRVHDSLQKSELSDELELHLRGLSSCNAVYCLWHFQKLANAEASHNTTFALSEMLGVDVKVTARMRPPSDIFSVCMFHNLAHIYIQTGEYLKAFIALGEEHKTLETAVERQHESVQEMIESLTSRNKGLMKSSAASIESAVSKWISIKDHVSFSENRISTGIQGIRELKQSYQTQRTPKRQKDDVVDDPDERQQRMNLSPHGIQQTLPKELFVGLFGSGAGRVRAAVTSKSGPLGIS